MLFKLESHLTPHGEVHGPFLLINEDKIDEDKIDEDKIDEDKIVEDKID